MRPSRNSLPGVVAGLYGVSKVFDSLWGGNLVRALTGVTLEVRRGEVFGLLGPPGSGKSTALRILAGRLRAMEGRAEVFGRSPRSGSVRARVGYLPERPRDKAPSRGSLREAFDRWLGLDKRGVRSATGGLMQALLNNPDLVLLDDPFAGVAEAGQPAIKQEIRALTKKGKSVVLATRMLGEAHGVCDRVAVFRAGAVAATGTFEELLARTEALDFLSPLLSASTAERVLDLIRDELRKEPVQIANMHPEVSRVGLRDLAVKEASSPAAAKPADSIDHGRLAELSRPAPSSDGISPPDLKSGG